MWLINKGKKYGAVFLVLGVGLLAFYVSQNWFQLLLIRGDSMSPAFHDLQLAVMDRRADEYTYGEVIAFRCEGLDAVLTKRVAACPGDVVQIREGILYVNDSVSGVFPAERLFSYAGTAEQPLQLDGDQYFVIGDNIEESKDSRYREIGAVRAENILGKVLEN